MGTPFVAVGKFSYARFLGPLAIGIGLVCVFILPASASAAVPVRSELAPIPGFDKACGTAVDTEGDVYVSSAGEGEIEIFDPGHDKIGSIADLHEPCGLGVDSKGRVYAVERETGSVARFMPTEYPFSNPPSYGSSEAFGPSSGAKGLTVDWADDRVYVAEGNRISAFQAEGTTGQNEVQRFRVRPPVTGGTFKLIFEGQETTPLDFDASPAEVQTALVALPAIGAGNVSVKEGEQGTRSYTVTYSHALGSIDLPNLEGDSSLLTGGTDNSLVFPPSVVDGFAFGGHIGEGELGEVTAVAAYTYPSEGSDRRTFLFAADPDSDEIEVLSGPDVKSFRVTRTINGAEVPSSTACPLCSSGFELGEGAAVGADPFSGHLFVYDSGHGVVDEFEASGGFVTQLAPPALQDAEPSGLAVLPNHDAFEEIDFSDASGSFKLGYEGESTPSLAFDSSAGAVQAALEGLAGIGTGNVQVRTPPEASDTYLVRFTGGLSLRAAAKITADIAGLSSGPQGAQVKTRVLPGAGPGRVYVSSGAGPGASLLSFGPLPDPSRAPLGPPLSKALVSARTVTTDGYGDVYVGTGSLVRVFGPGGAELTQFEDQAQPVELAVDRACNVYTLDRGNGSISATAIAYYAPSSCPPSGATSYARHAPPLVTGSELPVGDSALRDIAIGKEDRLLAITDSHVLEFESAADGSSLLDGDFAQGLCEKLIPMNGIASDPLSGDVYLSLGTSKPGQVCRVDGQGTAKLGGFDGANSPSGLLNAVFSLAVDVKSGHVITFTNGDGAVREFDGEGSFVAEFGKFTTSLNRPRAVAVDNSCALHEPPLDDTTTPTCEEFDPASGNVYVAFEDTAPGSFSVTAFGPLGYGEAPIVSTGRASEFGGGGARLHGTVNPRGEALVACRFEYVLESAFEEGGFADAESRDCTQTPAEIGNGNAAVNVNAAIDGLIPGERYRFRLVAENGFGASGLDDDGVLFGPPEVELGDTAPIQYSEATVRATIDPVGLDTEYHVEYGADGSPGNSTSVVMLDAGSGPTEVEIPLFGLEAGTTYGFRLVASNGAGSDEDSGELTTRSRPSSQSCSNAIYRVGASARLPDCRAYELVSPAQTGGLMPHALSEEDAGLLINSYLVSPRGEQAGERLTFLTSGTLPGFEGTGISDTYLSQRAQGEGDHPAAGWSTELAGPNYAQIGGGDPFMHAISPDQRFSLWVLRSDDSLPGALPVGTYLRVPVPGSGEGCGQVAPPGSFEVLGCGSLGMDLDAGTRFVSAGGKAIYASDAQLEPGAPAAGTAAIYSRLAGSTSSTVVSVQPGGAPFGAGENASFVGATEDGDSVVFKVGGKLYLNREGVVSLIAPAPNNYAGVSEDGVRVFYTIASAGSNPGSLKVFDAETQETRQIAAAAVFVNVPADGSRVFFTSEEALTGGEANEGGEVAVTDDPNLYVWDESSGETHFVAVLNPQDLIGFAGSQQQNLAAWVDAVNPGLKSGLGRSVARTTPDGGVLLFQSHAQLTSQENSDAKSSVYRYESAAPVGKRLVCVSCGPSGVAASGGDADLQSIDAASPLNAAVAVPSITDDGSVVFFQSTERLLPEDVNNTQDVYEWRAGGTGGCVPSRGCVDLISSGQGDRNSYLFGMSADGRDAILATQDRLLSSDVPGSMSLYDARSEGGIPVVTEKGACQGDACQPAPVNPPQLQAPGRDNSSSGNVVIRKQCGKGRHRVKGRCVKKTHRQRHGRKAHPQASDRGGRK